MIPTQRFYFLLLLAMAIAFLLATWFTLLISLSFIVIFDLGLLLLAFWDRQRVKNDLIEVQRHPLHKLSMGRDNPITLSVKSHQREAHILLRDDYPLQFKVNPEIINLHLSPNSKEEVNYTIFPHSRGEFQWGNIHIRQLSPWGLVWHNWQISAQTKAPVYPDLIGLRSLSIRLSLENTGTMRQARKLGQGTEFTELREYRTGDDTRIIDWKATARCSRPVVRVLEPEQEQTLIILLDRGRLMTAQVQGMKRFDWGLNAALSLALAGLTRGDRVGIAVFDREIITWIPPERGQQQLSHLIEMLTPIQPVLLEPDYVGAVTKLVNQQARRALVVLMTDIIDNTASAELLAALARLTPRYLPFCVALRDPQVDQIAHTSTKDIKTAYERAVALDLLTQRQVAFAQLKRKGVFVLDAPANQITEQLVNRYLQLKARSAI